MVTGKLKNIKEGEGRERDYQERIENKYKQLHTCNVTMVDYMNTDNMVHQHVTLSNDPQDEIYLDHTTVVRYKRLLIDIHYIISLFKNSVTDNNNHAAQIKTLESMISNINNKIRSECRHEYSEKNGKTTCKICSLCFP